MSRKNERSRSWDSVAHWYAGWVGARGSHHHREAVHPLALSLLAAGPGDHILDLGCGTGSLCRPLLEAGARYTGVDLSERMIAWARRHQPRAARFQVGDATRLDRSPVAGLGGGFTAVTFVLSIQDIEPLSDAIRGAARALAPGGRLVIAMTHPCFRIPRQSGWNWDANRRIASRRIDRYLTPLRVPMDPGDGSGSPGRGGRTHSFHRPLSTYMAALADAGLVVDAVHEVPAPVPPAGSRRPRGARGSGKRATGDARRLDNPDIPLFLGLRARRDQGAGEGG